MTNNFDRFHHESLPNQMTAKQMPERLQWLLTATATEMLAELRKQPFTPPELQAALIVAFRLIDQIQRADQLSAWEHDRGEP